MATDQPRPSGRLRTLLGYTLMLVATAAAYLYIRERGGGLVAPHATGPRFGATSAKGNVETLFHVLLALATVIVVSRLLGMLFKRLHQPAVMGEIIAGIALGPSLLGRVAPDVARFVMPPAVAPFLGVIAQVGVILFMFLVGLELDPALLRKRGHATVVVSHASILAPFLLGAVLALGLYPRLSTSDVPFTAFSLFLGVSMSVTAFPVLARILTDRNIHKSSLGVIALTCAAVDDATAWCLLAFVVGVVQAEPGRAALTVVLTVGYVALMVVAARPAMVRLTLVYGNRGRLTQGLMATVFVLLLVSSLTTNLIGIHAVFGAFLLGAVIPHDSGLARDITERLEDLVVVLLLPAFFAFTGMNTQIGLVTGGGSWLLCGLIVVVASVGKFGGSFVAARLTGLAWRDSAALGVLMNTRGLMELIVLDVGLELKVISPTLFAMLVIMAVVTTLATSPILHFVARGHPLHVEMAPPPRVGVLGTRCGMLVPISNPLGMPPLIELATAATRPNDPPPRLLALVRRPAGGIRSGLRAVDEKEPTPRAPLLAEAVEHARSIGSAVEAQAVWTDDPAADILAAAEAGDIGWLLLGFHRPVWGGDLMGGVVKDVLDRVGNAPLHIGVVIHGHERPLRRVIAVVDDSPDGRATLDLAVRIVQKKECTLHAVLVPRAGIEPERALAELVQDAARSAGRWLHTDVLARRDAAELAHKTHGELVLIGIKLADELGLPLDDVEGAERCVVVVRGALAAQPLEQAKAS